MITAAQTLTHYFRTLFTATGLHWDSDNSSEIEGAIDEILQAAQTAAAAKEPTLAALQAAGLVPPSGVQVWRAAQDAFRRIANYAQEAISEDALLDFIEREAARLPGAPTGTETIVQPLTSREVSPEAFGELLATHLADGQMDWGGED